MFVCRLLTNLISVSKTSTTTTTTNAKSTDKNNRKQYWWWFRSPFSKLSSSSNHHDSNLFSFSSYQLNLSEFSSPSSSTTTFQVASNLLYDSVLKDKNNSSLNKIQISKATSSSSSSSINLAQTKKLCHHNLTKTFCYTNKRPQNHDRKSKKSSISSIRLGRAFDYYKNICNNNNKNSLKLSSKEKLSFAFNMDQSFNNNNHDDNTDDSIDINDQQQQQHTNDLLARQKRFRITEKQLTYLTHKIVSILIFKKIL